MKVPYFRITGTLALCFCLFGMLSCAHDQQLVGITIQPDTETFGDSNTPVSADAGAAANLTAYGHYIHPPVTKNITTQVTWASNTAAIATVDANGVLTATGLACGNSLISATVQTNLSSGGLSSSGAVVTGFMTANVVCFSSTGSGGSGPILSVNFGGTGTGSITSSPSGLSCATNCSASFSSGTTVNITATANGTFGGWANCDSTSGPGGTVCTVNSLTANRAVTVTFN